VSRSPNLHTYDAILVRTSPWGERDRLAVLFEANRGILRARAISALEPGSKLAPYLVAPAIGRFTLARGRSPIPVLASVELADRLAGWRADGISIRVAGVALAVLEGLDAPEETNRLFFQLAMDLLLSNPSAHPLSALAVFLVQALGILGLLGGEANCSLCGTAFTADRVAAAPDLRTFICAECFNRLYGKAEVSVILVNREHLELLSLMALTPLADSGRLEMDGDALSFVFSLACARLDNTLPAAVSALLPLTAAPCLA